ncbi:hypothetical protein Rsub_10678 [Raphidocelis subcapitata]|uniref:Uncharacterized protein n=1 Tax=Raphidocelis subcapitata TaxID=307507 RepID=A0A2V0PE98_9CHLO|nr:hypothetical protein Rsub_10678 [Raphidocelis subcapitata]|eukprot:GBF98178.1 hypothetical protein Rsub_10678 [Raphidocelis subcapitata]
MQRPSPGRQVAARCPRGGCAVRPSAPSAARCRSSSGGHGGTAISSGGGAGGSAPHSAAAAATRRSAALAALASAALLLLQPAPPPAAAAADKDTFENVPGQLGSSGDDVRSRQPLSRLMQGKTGRAVEGCTRKCVPTCVRGGEGAPGLGPLSLRREPGGVVFAEGYRTRSYCLSECANVCSALLGKKQPPQ